LRLIIPLFFALLGAGIGALVAQLFKRCRISILANMLIGAFGSFSGLMLADFFDLTTGDARYKSLLAAIFGAFMLSFIVNLFATFFIRQDD